MATLRYIREVPEEDFKAIVDVLNAFDKNNNELIGRNDLLSVLQSLSKKLNKTEIKVLLHMVDKEENDLITFAEVFEVLVKYDAWMLERQEDNPKIEKSTEFKEAIETFKKIDDYGKKTIGSTEIQSALESADKEVTSTEVKYLMHLIEAADDDHEDVQFSTFFDVLRKLDRDTALPLPEEEYMAVVDVLDAFKCYKNRTIGSSDLLSVMQSLNKKLNKTDIKVLLHMLDEEDKLFITFAEVFEVLAKWDAWMLERQENNPKIEKSTEFKEALEAFKKLDENGKGTIESTELQSALESAGKEVTSTEVTYLEHLIEDGRHWSSRMEHGVIGFSEFFYALRKLDRDPAQQDGGHLDDKQIRALFRTFDVDGTGFVATDKLSKIARALDTKTFDNTCWYPGDLLDPNENDQINYEEFIPLVKFM